MPGGANLVELPVPPFVVFPVDPPAPGGKAIGPGLTDGNTGGAIRPGGGATGPVAAGGPLPQGGKAIQPTSETTVAIARYRNSLARRHSTTGAKRRCCAGSLHNASRIVSMVAIRQARRWRGRPPR